VLKQRVITAVLLLALLLPALFAAPAWPFAVLTLVLIGAAGWEWGRLNGAGSGSVVLGVLLASSCAAAMWVGWSRSAPILAWWLAAVVWVLGGAWALHGGPAVWPAVPRGVRWVVGMILLWAAWMAMANAKSVGINFILSVFCLVWVADIAAYFGGRALGRRKLAPSISPGKSWEGVWSGMAGALLLALVWLALDKLLQVDSQSLYTRMVQRFGAVGMGVVSLADRGRHPAAGPQAGGAL